MSGWGKLTNVRLIRPFKALVKTQPKLQAPFLRQSHTKLRVL